MTRTLAADVQLVLYTLFLFSLAAARVLGCYAPDRESLLIFAGGSSSMLPAQLSWQDENCCVWYEITCSSTCTRCDNSSSSGCCSSKSSANGSDVNARVTGIAIDMTLEDLQQHNQGASINFTSLCNLSALTSLSITVSPPDSDLSPPATHFHIPDCVGTHLTLLTNFSLDFSIEPPSTISIPASLSLLSNLRSFSLYGWHNIDLELSAAGLLNLPLESLVTLSIASCSLVGSSLHALFTSPNLTSVELDDCSLSGPLPPFNNTLLLQRLVLRNNLLTSTLEDFFLHSNLPALIFLDLSSNNLLGAIPDQFFNLFPNLISAYLADNNFSGPFPAAPFKNLALHELDLSANHLSGALPEEWGRHWSSLESLSLSGNEIATTHAGRRLPHWLFTLPLQQLALASTGLQSKDCVCDGMLSLLNRTLNHLDVSGNSLTGPDILNCFNLNSSHQDGFYLNLSSNPLAFPLCARSQLSPQLDILDLSHCRLYGPFPLTCMHRNSGFYSLLLANNSLFGPMNIYSGAVDTLDLSYNGFTEFNINNRSQPAFAHDLKCWNLPGILLSHNSLAGDVSSVFSNKLGLVNALECWAKVVGPTDYGTASTGLDLSHNTLTGEIPTQAAADLSSIFQRILLNNNRLVGSIPYELGGPNSNLVTLKLNNNRLTGSIPNSILNTPSLQLLDLSYNQLETDFTTLFSSITHPTPLRVLLLSHNQIHGSIPPFFGGLTPSLQLIDVSHNNLSGAIPPNLQLSAFLHIDQSSVSVTTASQNKLYEEVKIVVKGTVQSYKYELKALTTLDVSNNRLVGGIPSQFGQFVGLRYLNLSGNLLSGSIPATLSKLSVLESMDLSSNQLQGQIPSSFSNLTSLETFNVSFNRGLEGPIPSGSAFLKSSFTDDPGLCGYPILHACGESSKEIRGGTLPKANKEDDEEEADQHTFLTWLKEWVALPGLCLGIVVGFVGTLWVIHVFQFPKSAPSAIM